MADETTTLDQPHRGAAAPSLQPFTVEFGDDHGRTITINSLKLRVRGAFDRQKLERGVGDAMNMMPRIPGLRMKVEPRHRRYTLFDPLEEDKATLDRINRTRDNAPAIATGAGKFTFVPAVTAELGVDEFKSLVLDLISMRQGEMLRTIDGRLPTQEMAAAMDGKELYDPWSSSSRKPRYAEDAEAYHESLDRRGQ